MKNKEKKNLAREILEGIVARLIEDGDTDGAASIASILQELQGENGGNGEN